MEHHNLFHTLAALVFLAAIAMAFVVTWASAPFFLFALALLLRGMSLKKASKGLKVTAYVLFALGIVLLIYYIAIYNLLQ